jgi:enoyl-CoA hydratase
MSEVLVERPADGVVLLRLNRPQARNALNNAVRLALAGNFRGFAALGLERRAYELLFDTQDQKEGMQAFAEKRKPRFQGG